MALNNYGYSRVYTPVLRKPCLFHQNTTRSTPIYYPPRLTPTSSINNAYHPTPSRFTRVQSPLPYLPQSYPYSLSLSNYSPPASLPFFSYSIPTFSYTPTVTSKGTMIILIAILVLVALDLVIVRPQKSWAEVRSLKSTDQIH